MKEMTQEEQTMAMIEYWVNNDHPSLKEVLLSEVSYPAMLRWVVASLEEKKMEEEKKRGT